MNLNLYYDIDQNALVTGLSTNPLGSLLLRRDQTYQGSLYFVSNGVQVDPGAPVITFIGKSLGAYTQNPPLFLLAAAAFTKNGTGAEAVWNFTLVLNTSTITTLMSVNGLDALQAQLEVSYVLAGAENISQAVPTPIQNNLYQGTEAPPWPAFTPTVLYPLNSITGLIGGGSTNLDGLNTQGIFAPGVWIAISVPDPNTSQIGVEFWALTFGTQATNPANGFVRPLDYNADTWTYVWVRKG